MHLVGTFGLTRLDEALQFAFDVDQHLRVEQLAQFLCAEEVVQQVAIERECRCATLGERRIAFVHVGGDPVEQQALGER